MKIGVVAIVRCGFAVAGNVEPVLAPALAVMFGSEKAVDQFGKGIGRHIVIECLDLHGCGRQPGQVKRHPADKLLPGGRRCGLEPVRFQLA